MLFWLLTANISRAGRLTSAYDSLVTLLIDLRWLLLLKFKTCGLQVLSKGSDAWLTPDYRYRLSSFMDAVASSKLSGSRARQ